MTIQVLKYKPVNQGKLLGYLDVEIQPWKLQIRGISLFQDEGRRWLNMPAQSFVTKDGEKKWSPLVKFSDKETWNKFESGVKRALDEYARNQQP